MDGKSESSFSPPGEITIGNYIAQRLKQLSVSHFFTVPGDFTLSLLDELIAEPSLKMVPCCNELTAGYAADGYCRASGGLGMVCVTYMVGGLSVINAVAGAYSEDLPLLVISGGPNNNDSKQGHRVHHTIGEMDLYQGYRCFQPVTAGTFVIQSINEAADKIDNAISLCLSKRKPVYLEVPCNLSLCKIAQPCPMENMDLSAKRVSDNHSQAACVDHILHLVNKATRIVLVAGNKLRMTDAVDEFMHLANALGCGISIFPCTKGMINEEHPNFMGVYWSDASPNRRVMDAIEAADLVIYVGCVLSDYTMLDWSNKSNKQLLPDSIRIQDHHTWVHGSRYHGLVMSDILSALAVRVPLKETSAKEFNALMQADHASNQAAAESTNGGGENATKMSQVSALGVRVACDGPLTSQGVVCALQAEVDRNPHTSLLVETGDAWFIGQKVRLSAQGGYYMQLQYGSIGWALGACIGIKKAVRQNNKRLIAVIGDGSFQVTVEALSTLIRERAVMTVLVTNNRGYAIEARIHDGPYNYIQCWDYAALPEVFSDHPLPAPADGVTDAPAVSEFITPRASSKTVGVKAHTYSDLSAALLAADGYNGLTLIECMLPQNDATEEMVRFGKKISACNSRRAVE